VSRRIWHDGRVVEEWDDAARTYRRYDSAGSLVEERPYTGDEAAALVAAESHTARTLVRNALLAKTDAALQADLTYLDSVVPATGAERLTRVETQVERLTRQVVALLRLVGERLDDTAGS